MSALNVRLARPQDPLNQPRVSCSVVLCTLGRSAGLLRAVGAVLRQADVDFELVVVDNDPASGRVVSRLDGLHDPRLRVVVEPQRGLSAARNAGVRAARGPVVAFTDDDCEPDPQWLSSVVALLGERPEVAAVTGRTEAGAGLTPVQALFEEFGSFDRGTEPKVWRYPASAPLPWTLAVLAAGTAVPAVFPYSAVYGSGNNMAFRREVLDRVGPFDESLGAGSPAAGGEDLDMFIRLMLAGLVLVYEPQAIVRHTHRADLDALAEQVRGYGSGLAAMLTKHLLTSPAGRVLILRRLVPGLRLLLGSRSPKNVRKSRGYPAQLTRSELVGFAAGPWLYLRGRRDQRRRSAGQPPTPVPARGPGDRAVA